MSSANQFESKKTLPLFFSMVIPPMLSMFIQSLYNIVDSMFVSALGENAIAAVSIVFPLQNITLALSVGIGVGTSSYVARCLGAKQEEKASSACVISLALSILNYIFIIIAAFFALRPFVESFTSSPEVIEYSIQYGAVVLFLCIGQQVQIVIEKIFQSYGKMMVPMYQLILGCVINIVLDPIMIYGLFGCPKMGVMGAAIATVIGQWAACLFGIALLLSPNSDIKLRFYRDSCHPVEIAKEIYSVAVPSILVIALPSVLVSCLNGILSHISQMSVSMFGIYYKLQSFVFMPTSGLVQGIRPIVGYNYAAKNLRKEKEIIKISLVTVAIIMAIGTAVLWGAPQWVMSLFHADSDMLSMGIELFCIVSIGFIPSTFSFITCAEFEAIGKANVSLVITLFRQLIILLPCAYILSLSLGTTGVWLAFPIAEVIMSVVCAIMLKAEFKKRVQPSL
ncbi:MAG: MATE family efflux transporter [Oscillospiraceae bacterium]